MAKKETVISILKDIRDSLKSSVTISIPATPIIQKQNSRFIRYSDGTVKDNLLNLIWYPAFEKKLTWQEAKKECEKLGGRLPTRQELESLLDLTKYNPATNKDIFPDTKTDDYYWSGTEVAGNPGSAWDVSFYNGDVDGWGEDGTNYARAVRSSQ